jgi:PhnB protein
MRISPHLTFNGQCRAAFTRYHQLLGGELRMLTFGDSPMAADVEPRWHDRIVHVTLQIGDFELAGADVLPEDYATPQGFSVLLTFEDSVKAEHVFNELASGGEVKFPFQSTFWSAGFGVLLDEFGIPWEVSCAQSPSA